MYAKYQRNRKPGRPQTQFLADPYLGFKTFKTKGVVKEPKGPSVLLSKCHSDTVPGYSGDFVAIGLFRIFLDNEIVNRYARLYLFWRYIR